LRRAAEFAEFPEVLSLPSARIACFSILEMKEMWLFGEISKLFRLVFLLPRFLVVQL
jgi:hypothetical protein